MYFFCRWKRLEIFDDDIFILVLTVFADSLAASPILQ